MITHPRTEELAQSVALWIEQIRPSLDPRNAFLARVAANAMATIGREITQGPAAEAEAVDLIVVADLSAADNAAAVSVSSDAVGDAAVEAIEVVGV